MTGRGAGISREIWPRALNPGRGDAATLLAGSSLGRGARGLSGAPLRRGDRSQERRGFARHGSRGRSTRPWSRRRGAGEGARASQARGAWQSASRGSEGPRGRGREKGGEPFRPKGGAGAGAGLSARRLNQVARGSEGLAASSRAFANNLWPSSGRASGRKASARPSSARADGGRGRRNKTASFRARGRVF
jgi:hypothetical protein